MPWSASDGGSGSHSTHGAPSVLANARGQVSMWPSDIAVPAGWTHLFSGDVAECADYIRERSSAVVTRGGCAEGRATIDAAICAQARATPEAIALVCGSEQLTYREMIARAAELADDLKARGVTSGVVAIEVPRAVAMAVAVIGVLMCGAAYTMLDESLPSARRDQVCHLAGVSVVVSAPAGDAGGFLIQEMATVPTSDTSWLGEHPDKPAMVMFTSGSTGEPKGVLTGHRAILSTFQGQDFVDFDAHRVWLQCSPVSWDAFALELFGALLSGARCVLQDGGRPEPADIARAILRQGVDTIYVSTGLLNVLVDDWLNIFSDVRQVMTGGEPPSADHLSTLLNAHPHLVVVNGYSPLENTIFTLCHRVDLADCSGTQIPVGRALDGKDVYLLDEAMQPVRDGVVGEVYMAGHGLAYGYVGNVVETASRFLADPFGEPGERMYKTGDLGVRSGELVTLRGRADRQVKVGGYRIEPGEIESALLQTGLARRAFVGTHPSPDGAHQLVAWLVPSGTVDGARVKRALRDRLPEQLIPTRVVVVSQLPLSATGKVDHQALADRLLKPAEAPTTRVGESVTSGLVDLVLARTGVEVDPTDNLIALGINSLDLIAVLSQVRTRWGVELRMSSLFPDVSIAAIATHLDREL